MVIDAGGRLAVATAIEITGSAPRTIGTSMAVTDDGTVIGSISGGCVEGAVYELCRRVLETGETEVESFGFDDDAAFAVGLSCGGRIRVVARLITADVASAVTPLRAAVAGRSAACAHLDPQGAPLFVERTDPPPRLIVFGAVEFGVALCAAAAALGYRVSVCDARSVFATTDRFPAAAEVVVEWPTTYLSRTEVDTRTVICVLTHDERFDVDLVQAALATDAGYVGAMGSRVTHEARVRELAVRGVTDLGRLHSPIGLDLGASTPEETAISILAEVLAERTGATGTRLASQTGPIHRPIDHPIHHPVLR